MNPTTMSILDVFEKFRMAPTMIDQYEQTGKSILADKMSSYVASGDPIEFVMLGFPYKSVNIRDKVIGTLPDLGEEVTLNNFAAFDQKVKEVYAPGIKLNVVSDGLVFNTLKEIPDNTVMDYYEANKDTSKNTSAIQWYNAKDFYPSRLSVEDIRGKIVSQFGITEEELSSKILTDPDTNFLYMGMIRFAMMDIAYKVWGSTKQCKKAAKIIAREMMVRNEAYSKLVSSEFKDAIRLSMHPSLNNGNKYSIQLIPGPAKKVWTAPWHCAILVDSEKDYVTIHRKDAEAAGYKLINVGGRPFYYVEN